MEQEPQNNEKLKSLENISFKIVEKNDITKKEVFYLLHQYPNHFIQGLFEEVAEVDFFNSDVVVAYKEGQPVGCLMFDRKHNEFNWLAVSKEIKGSRSEIAKQLFETFYPSIQPGTEVHLYVNTEDATVEGHQDFSGSKFEAARRLYKSMGLEIKEENRIENKYGLGSHAYLVKWVPNK